MVTLVIAGCPDQKVTLASADLLDSVVLVEPKVSAAFLDPVGFQEALEAMVLQEHLALSAFKALMVKQDSVVHRDHPVAKVQLGRRDHEDFQV